VFRALISSFVLAFLTAASPAAAGVSVGHSGWFWGNPVPQGNALFDTDFTGTTGYAAGQFGTLLRTTDAGATWTGLATGMTDDLTELDVIDGTTVVVGSECALRRSDDAGESFRRLPFTPSEARCTRQVADLSFVDRSIGLIVLKTGTVLATSDGGRSFSPRTALPGTQQAGGSAEPTAVLMTATDRALATTSGGKVFLTTDGGRSWDEVHSSFGALRDIFMDGSAGVVAGDNGAFAATTDSGATWQRIQSTAPYAIGFDLRQVECSFSRTVCIATVVGGGLVRSDDGGLSWEFQMPIAAHSLAFTSADRVVVVGELGATLVSDNAGDDFREIGRNLDISGLGRMRATSAGVAHIAGSRGALARTVDGGETWINVGVATSETVRDSSFPTADLGFALDADGGLFRTDNGGTSWGILDTGTSERPRAVLAPDAVVVLLVGPTGVRRSIDGGDSFAAVRDSDVRSAALSDVDRAGAAVVVFGGGKLAVSTNRGRTWRSMRRPSRRRSIVSADFVSSRTGFVLLSDGRVFSTGDGGGHWRELLGVGNGTGAQLSFGDSKNGWLIVNNFLEEGAYVLRTNNAGASWRPQLLGDGSVRSIAAGSATSAFAHLNGRTEPASSFLLATANGGDRGSLASMRLSSSPKRPRRGRRFEIRGRLSGARGGEQIVVSSRRLDRTVWNDVLALVGRDGTFTVDKRARRPTVYVAQWGGDEERAGAASLPLTVRPRR
jgi:photosystem II stability/assembly factor-like uncharacterized protein